MDIIIGKSDIAALGCEGCKKKFVCNIANNDPANRAYIEGALGVNIPEKDPPAIIDNSGGEGEKGIILYLLSQGKSIVSMDVDNTFGGRYADPIIGAPFMQWNSTNLASIVGEQSKDIGKAQYLTGDANSFENEIISIARRGVNYLYQVSIEPNFSSIYPALKAEAVSEYVNHSITTSKTNRIRPDLIEIISPQVGYSVLDSTFREAKSDGSKYILRICDIKTSEFTSSFYFELAYYMLLMRTWLTDTGLDVDLEIAYDAKIFPFDIVNNSIREEKGWMMDFSLVRDKLFAILNEVMPSVLISILHGEKALVEKVKCSPKCQVCDYYGGQFEGKLYQEKLREDSVNGENNYRNYVKDPNNNYCRFYLQSIDDINIIPDIHSCDIKYLQDRGLDNLVSLKRALLARTPVQDNSKFLSNSYGILREIDTLKTASYGPKVDATYSLPKAMSQLRIFTHIRQDSQQRLLSCGISYSIYVPNVDPLTTVGMTVNASGALVENAEVMLVEVDSPDSISKLSTMVSYINHMRETLEKYRDVEYLDTFGRRQKVSYGIYYWGRKTYDSFKTNLQEIIEYMSNHGGSISALYAGTRMSTANINAINTSLLRSLNAFADMFSEEQVTNYERILKNPLFDLQRIYKDVVAVDTFFQYNILDVYNMVAGRNDYNYYYRPDSDNYSVYIYDKWYAIDRVTQPVEKNDFEAKLKAADRMHLYYLSILLSKLYDYAGPIGAVVKKGNGPVLGSSVDRTGINSPELLLLYLFRRLDAAYEQVEIEDAHVSTDVKKQYGGKSIYLERYLNVSELSAYSLTLRPNQVAYKIPPSAENANYDENSFGLTIYPRNQFSETFKKFTNDPRYSTYCICISTRLPEWTMYTGTLYTDIINCSIRKININQGYIVIEYEDWVRDIITELSASHGFDYTRDLYIEASFKDIWSGRLKNTIKNIQGPRSINKLNLLMNPCLVHDNAYTEADVERVLLSVIPTGGTLRLDSSQKNAIANMYNDSISLLWGPPGTGKSHTLAHYLMLELIERTQCKVLLLGNYTATDNLLNGLLKTLYDYGTPAALCQKLGITRFHSAFKQMEILFAVSGVALDEWTPQATSSVLSLPRNFSIISSTPESFAQVIKSNISTKARAIDSVDIIIVDEASQMDIGHFLPGLLKAKSQNGEHTKLIIAGDDKQLQPVQRTRIKNDERSWFGSIYNYYKNAKDALGRVILTPSALEISRRSNHCIIDFIRDAFDYNRNFRSDTSIALSMVNYSFAGYSSSLYEKCLRPEVGLALLVYEDGLSTQKNAFEEQQIVDFVLEIWRKGISSRPDFKKFFSDGVGIVIPHRAQCTAIKNRLISEFRRLLPPGSYTDAEIIETISSAVDTVERFQGQQKDIIIAGYVLGNEDAIGNEEAFIYDPCRLNVVISRARYKAVILASKELMDNISNDLEILELQKSFQKLKDYCCDISYITEPGWNNGVLYLREI